MSAAPSLFTSARRLPRAHVVRCPHSFSIQIVYTPLAADGRRCAFARSGSGGLPVVWRRVGHRNRSGCRGV